MREVNRTGRDIYWRLTVCYFGRNSYHVLKETGERVEFEMRWIKWRRRTRRKVEVG